MVPKGRVIKSLKKDQTLVDVAEVQIKESILAHFNLSYTIKSGFFVP